MWHPAGCDVADAWRIERIEGFFRLIERRRREVSPEKVKKYVSLVAQNSYLCQLL